MLIAMYMHMNQEVYMYYSQSTVTTRDYSVTLTYNR